MRKSQSDDPFAQFTPAMFHILLVLTAHECHGYGIMQEVAAQTDGGMRLGPGTLYRSIKQLVSAGLIAESRNGRIRCSTTSGAGIELPSGASKQPGTKRSVSNRW
jgi:DNA-binding MarR family transcriptional regulator